MLFVLLSGFVLVESREDHHDHFVRQLDTSTRGPSRITSSVQESDPTPRADAQQPVPSGLLTASRAVKQALGRPSDQSNRCPLPMTSCPILSSNVAKKLLARTYAHKDQTIALPWECVNLQEDLTACGTCQNNCMKIKHVQDVGCEAGTCKIFTCRAGYALVKGTSGLRNNSKVDRCVSVRKGRA
ncbi:hypothetical protein PCANC_18010 [Puccinia coronata f. sp. avenae]|uniref:Protein CPL1-like domain-containing protein n=1 Tax=Puccinia coronata f. sp. avenae TaxID=200324 RepID=A0A2N5SJ34_9BASI|nr:hypothetical protein PCANC_18010 [Puccinia coronata f. sp. avenae]